MRVALYWAPEANDPLMQAGNRWLGRDPELGAAVAQPALAGLEEATADPRAYGFHATLRPPMRLATGWEEFIAAARAVAGQIPAFDLPPLRVMDMAGFLALGVAPPCPALQALADACVTGTNPHRLPPGDAELAKRRRAGLSARQEAMLARFGYPYVLEEWRFHMTLTRRLSAGEMAWFRPAAEAHFAASMGVARRVQSIAVFTQLEGQPFLVSERLKLKEAVLF